MNILDYPREALRPGVTRLSVSYGPGSVPGSGVFVALDDRGPQLGVEVVVAHANGSGGSFQQRYRAKLVEVVG